ncbi:MAG TPA: hypothetical protein VEC08_06220 [Nitrososphaerales archaeon]|nr:hypothetical protein [Nitrososphaerales archaeon]
MVSIPSQFTHFLNGLPIFIVLLIVSLLLIFAGRKVVKALAFLVVGLIGASIGGTLAAQYISSLGWFGSILGILIGFFAGGLLGLLVVRLGIGLAVGYAAYVITVDIVSSTIAGIIVGFVFFLTGVVLYNKILTLVTALAGGFLLFTALNLPPLNLPSLASAAIAIIITMIGLWVDFGRRKRRAKATFTGAFSSV